MIAAVASLVLLLPAAAAGPFPPGEAAGALSLQDAVVRALQHNPELQIERDAARVAAAEAVAAHSAFDPTMASAARYYRLERYSNSVLEVAPFLEEGVIQDTGATPELSLEGKGATGFNYAFGVRAGILDTNNPLRLYDKSYTPAITFEMEQPLARNAGVQVNTARIRQADQLETRAAEDLRARALLLVREVETAYWELAYAQAHRDVVRDGLQSAQTLVTRLERLLAAGIVTDLDLAQAQVEAKRREARLHLAEADVVRRRSDLRLRVDPLLAQEEEIQVQPAAAEAPPAYFAQELVTRALAERPELRAHAAAAEVARYEETLARSEGRWRVDALAGASYTGLAGRGLGPRVVFPLPEPLVGRETLSDGFEDGNVSWSLGFRLEAPLSRRAAWARREVARLRVHQEETRLQSLRSQIAADVQIGVADVGARWASLQASQQAVALADRQEQAEIRNLEAGLSTTWRVLQAQDAAIEARDAAMRAASDLAIARAGLEAVVGSAFERYGVQVRP